MAVPFYRYSLETAKSEDNVELYRASIEENRRCKDFVQDSKTGFFANAYKDNSVDSDGLYTKNLIKEFGMERVLNMYAVTVRGHSGDGEYTEIFFRAYLCPHSFRSRSVLWAVSISRKIILIIKFILLFEACVLPDIHSKFFSLVFSYKPCLLSTLDVTGGHRQHIRRL